MGLIRQVSRMAYQAAYALTLLLPGSQEKKETRARAFATKAEENARKHAPAAIAVALNGLVIFLIGQARFRDEQEKDETAIEAVVDSEGFFSRTAPTPEPPGGGGGSAAAAVAAQGQNVSVNIPTQTPAIDMTALTTMAPSTFSMNVLAPSVSGTTAETMARLSTSGSGTGTGTGNGSGTGSGNGAGAGTGNGMGDGTGSRAGNQVIDNRIPVILLHMGRRTNLGRTPGWNAEQSVQEWDKAMAHVESLFRITEKIECGAAELAAHIKTINIGDGYEDKGIEGMLNFPESTASHLVETIRRNKEAKAIIFLASWDDGRTLNGPTPDSVRQLTNILREHKLPMVLFNYMVGPTPHWNRIEIEISKGSGGAQASYAGLEEVVSKVIRQPQLPPIPPPGGTTGFANPKFGELINKLKEKGVNPSLLEQLKSEYGRQKEIPPHILQMLENMEKQTPP